MRQRRWHFRGRAFWRPPNGISGGLRGAASLHLRLNQCNRSCCGIEGVLLFPEIRTCSDVFRSNTPGCFRCFRGDRLRPPGGVPSGPERKSPAEGSSVAAPYSANTPVIALDSDGSAAVSVTVPRDIIVLAVAVVAVTVSWATDTNPEAWPFKVYPLGQARRRSGSRHRSDQPERHHDFGEHDPSSCFIHPYSDKRARSALVPIELSANVQTRTPPERVGATRGGVSGTLVYGFGVIGGGLRLANTVGAPGVPVTRSTLLFAPLRLPVRTQRAPCQQRRAQQPRGRP